jgi:hypothetical protein
MKTTVSAIILVITIGIVTVAAIDALDKNIYPGCKVIDQQDKILIIKLDKDLEEPTDINCQRVGKLVYQIARDGYMVQIQGSHFENLGVIDILKAIDLAQGY